MDPPDQASDPRSLLSTTLAGTHLSPRYPLYQWKPLSDPLKQIRVLNFVPSFDSNEIKCNLEIVSHVIRPSPRPYQALSYVWGNPNERVPMTLFEDDKPFTEGTWNVPAPGFRSIFNFPNLSPPQLRLWVDALCIDQSNDRERNMQVQIMGEIYARSFGVLVWLGPIHGTGMEPSVEEIRGLLYDGLTKETYRQKIDHGDTAWLATLWKLFLLPWWSRVWVVQEVVLGPDAELVYGTYHIPWEQLRAALDHAGLIEKYNPAHHTELENKIHHLAAGFIQLDEQKKHHESFGEVGSMYAEPAFSRPQIDVVLWAYRTRKASIHHDKLYALLGLADRTIPIVPYYTKPIESVFCELAKALIIRIPNPTFPLDHIGFTHCAKQHKLHDKLPSWVPDWTACQYDIQLLGNYDPWISSFCADDHILSSSPTLLEDLFARKSWQPHQLPILGVELGHLTRVGQDNSMDLGLMDWPQLIKSWASLSPYPSNHIFIQTLLGGRFEDRRTRINEIMISETPLFDEFQLPHVSPSYQKWYAAVLKYNLQKDLLPLDLAKRFAEAAKGWTIGCTTGNLLALLPSNAKEKDLICVPIGSSTPFLIRSTGKTDDGGFMQYNLVGRCYVHGFMDGEALAGKRTILNDADHREVSEEAKQKLVLEQTKCFVLV